VLHESSELPLQSIEGASRRAVSVTRPLEPSWCHRPLQSLVGWRGSERTGCSPPVRPVRSRRPARPVFPSPPAPGDATHRVLLSWGSATSTVFPKSLCVTSRSRTTLMGFCPLQRIGLRESTASPVARPSARGFPPGVPPTVPPAGYGAAHRFSQPLSDVFLSRPVHLFQVAGAPGVPPSRGLILPRSPVGSSPAACPPDVPPEGCAAPVLGWERPQARGPET
jgi:hypothetical protein